VSRAVYRFEIVPGKAKMLDRVELSVQMPAGATVLSAGVKTVPVGSVGGVPGEGGHLLLAETTSLWALCDPAQPLVTRRFVVLYTGESVEDKVLQGARFVATVLGFAGRNVTHVFEVDTAVPASVPEGFGS